jgi:hypothetical protein
MAAPRAPAIRPISGRLVAAVAVVAGMMVVGDIVVSVTEGWRQGLWSAPMVAGSVVGAAYGWWRWRTQLVTDP